MTQNYTINCIQLQLQFVLAEPGYCPPWGRHLHMAVLAGAKALWLSVSMPASGGKVGVFVGKGLIVFCQEHESCKDPGVPQGF